MGGSLSSSNQIGVLIIIINIIIPQIKKKLKDI